MKLWGTITVNYTGLQQYVQKKKLRQTYIYTQRILTRNMGKSIRSVTLQSH
jgi:hypothetical protein